MYQLTIDTDRWDVSEESFAFSEVGDIPAGKYQLVIFLVILILRLTTALIVSRGIVKLSLVATLAAGFVCVLASDSGYIRRSCLRILSSVLQCILCSGVSNCRVVSHRTCLSYFAVVGCLIVSL